MVTTQRMLTFIVLVASSAAPTSGSLILAQVDELKQRRQLSAIRNGTPHPRPRRRQRRSGRNAGSSSERWAEAHPYGTQRPQHIRHSILIRLRGRWLPGGDGGVGGVAAGMAVPAACAGVVAVVTAFAVAVADFDGHAASARTARSDGTSGGCRGGRRGGRRRCADRAGGVLQTRAGDTRGGGVAFDVAAGAAALAAGQNLLVDHELSGRRAGGICGGEYKYVG